ncbi:MAG: phage gp6-like head-tail connector protein [Ottowia sp.]|nr:phage gp6-like head-tail connector protein [Ottowia sp.]
MSIISMADALSHLRLAAGYPATQVQPYLDGAEAAAQAFLNRRVFATSDALETARAGLPAALAAAASARDADLAAAAAMTDCQASQMLRLGALGRWAGALQGAEEVARGIVINDGIKVGILLLLGHLFENRATVVAGSTVTEIPVGAQHFLLPHRVGWGG